MLFDLGLQYYNYCGRCTSSANLMQFVGYWYVQGKFDFVMICKLTYANITL